MVAEHPHGRAPDVPHGRTSREVADDLEVDPRRGLSAEEARRRLERFGPNRLPRQAPPGAWRILGRQFKSPLLWILGAAIVLSVALGERIEAIAITLITVFTVVLGFVQEYRAQQAMESLARMAAPGANVLRDGETVKVAAEEVVPGDVLVLGQGDVVPADGRLVEAADLRAGEAALTGESVGVEKEADAQVAPDAPVGDRVTMVYGATTVAAGRARAVVTATGADTEVGRIGALMAAVEPTKTPLERQIARFSRFLVWATGALVVLVVALGLGRGMPIVDVVIFGIALAVAAVPEALPAVVTISLAVGAQRMARRHALVRRLPTVETLGGTTVICTDKTGTLTTGEMTVTALHVARGRLHVTGVGFDPEGRIEEPPEGEARAALAALVDAAVLCNDASLQRGEAGWSVSGDPTEAALVVLGAKAGRTKASLEERQRRVDEIPFSSETKRMTTVHEVDGRRVAYVKGAPRVVLEASDRVWDASGVHGMDEDAKRGVRADVNALAEEGMRVLAVAMHDAPGGGDAEEGLIFLGLVGIRDPPRTAAKEAIARCRDAGIRVVMITGDHPSTARAIARELGIDADEVTSGPDMERANDDDLPGIVRRTTVYARVSPEHKLRIVTALQSEGHVVAMTGDGVNDAPALRRADIGIAMGITGTDVAKEAAGMTLADDDFASIEAAVEEGRTIFDNVRKYIVYLLSTNLGELALITVAILLGMPLPLTAVMILYVNLASDGLPAIALGVDPREEDVMRRRPRSPGAPILDGPIIALMVIGGLWAAAATLGVFWYAETTGVERDVGRSMTLATLVLAQFVMGFSFRTERHALIRRPFANKWYNLAVLWEVALLMVVLYVPPVQTLFGTAAVPYAAWLLIVVAVLSVVPVLEGVKWLARRGARSGAEATTVAS